MKTIIKKGIAKGTIDAISSKSYLHRYIIACALAGDSMIKCSRLELSDDIKESLSCICELGANYKINNNSIFIDKINCVDNVCLHFKKSASTMRFLIPIACSIYNNVTFIISKSLYKRGIEEYINIFNNQGIRYKIEELDDSIKLNVFGKLKSSKYNINTNLSSQFVSGLLMALALLDGDSELEVDTLNSNNYIDITLDVLNKCGIKIKQENNKYYIEGKQKYKKGNYVIEGDESNMAYLLAYNYFGSNIKIDGIKDNSLQGDKVAKSLFEKLDKECVTIDVNNCIDLSPILFTFATLKHGAKFTGCKRLISKESNRIDDLLLELAKIGTQYEVSNDYDNVIIYKTDINNLYYISFDSHNDHRIVMALSLVLSLIGGEINNSEAVNKSYPSYFSDLNKLGIITE